jgi:hypothetical protein
VISRYLVIALAFIAAAVKAGQGAGVEASGLFGLGAGLVALRFSAGRPVLKVAAFLCFFAMALAIGIVLIRRSF